MKEDKEALATQSDDMRDALLSSLLTMPNTSDGHVQCGESKGKKEKQFIKETVLRTTNGTYYSALFSIEIIQSERNVLCISSLLKSTI